MFLLEKGASVDAISKDGKSSLLYAASLGHEKILDTLITHKASLELRDKVRLLLSLLLYETFG